MNPIDVLCIGHACFDLSVSVESFPRENTKCETSELRESGGGPAANAAYLLSRWGVGCAYAGVVGDDRYGALILDEFRAAGTDVSLIESREGHASPVSFLIVNKQNGSRTIVNRKIPATPLQLAAGALRNLAPKVLLFDGHELPALMAALEALPGAISILDAGSLREGAAALAGKVGYLAASERFALQATGFSDLNDAQAKRACMARLRERYSNVVIVTLGEHGLMADGGTGFFELPAPPANAVDTTAAGDIFHGAFAYGVLQSWPLMRSLRFASLTASLSVREPGGRASIPPLKTVKEHFAHAG